MASAGGTPSGAASPLFSGRRSRSNSSSRRRTQVKASATLKSGGGGVWMERWSWDGEDGLVSAREIGEKVKAAMADAEVRARAARASQEATKAVAQGGTSYRSMQEFIGKLKATKP